MGYLKPHSSFRMASFEVVFADFDFQWNANHNRSERSHWRDKFPSIPKPRKTSILGCAPAIATVRGYVSTARSRSDAVVLYPSKYLQQMV